MLEMVFAQNAAFRGNDPLREHILERVRVLLGVFLTAFPPDHTYKFPQLLAIEYKPGCP